MGGGAAPAGRCGDHASAPRRPGGGGGAAARRTTNWCWTSRWGRGRGRGSGGRGRRRTSRLCCGYGRPIRYAYTERDQPLSAYRTVFAVPSADGSGSAEMPSAARPFTAGLVAALVSHGVQFAPLTLHTGVASARRTSRPTRSGSRCRRDGVAGQRGAGGRRPGDRGGDDGGAGAGVGGGARTGWCGPAAGWTDLVVTPERGVRAVDGLLTGLHEPRGLAPADAGGGRGAGGAAPRVRAALSAGTCGTSSGTST